MKTMVRPSARAFFYRRPFHPFPTADPGFIPFDGPAFRTLTAESIVAQQPPDMTWMVLHTGEFLDQGCNARERPQVGIVTTANWARHQRLDHLFGLIGGQLGLTTGLSLAGKARLAAFDPSLLPPVGDLSGHSKPSAHFRGGNALLEEGGCPNPPFLHLGVVTLRWHDRIIHGGLERVTLLCETQ